MAKSDSVQNKLLPIMVVALIVAAFVLGMMWGKVQVYEKGLSPNIQGAAGDVQVAPEEPTQVTEDQWNELLADPVYAFGEEDASVVIVEFTDFECPFCQRYFNDTFGQIKENYVDTGKVRYIMHDLPLSFHASAKDAAVAARCSGDQGKYIEMHDLIFAGQQDWAAGDAEEVFSGYASDLGINSSSFSSCYSSGKYDDAIDADLDLAASMGASGTPTFFINGTTLVGAQPFTAFEELIEASL